MTSASTMRFKEPVKKRIILGLTVMLLGIGVLCGVLYTQGIHSADSVAIVIVLTLILAWFLICSADPFFVSLFNFLTCINIYIAVSYISSIVSMHADGVEYVLKYNIARTIMYGLVIPLMFKFVRPHFRRLVTSLGKEWMVASLVPLMFLLLQVVLLYYPVPYFFWEGENWNRIVIAIVYVLFLVVYYLLSIQASDIIEKYALENRNLLMVQQDKLWQAELARQKVAVALASQQRHDMHHHNAVIMEMLRSGKLSQLEGYMQNFEAALEMSQSTVYCKNPIINSICNAYAKKAKQAQIEISFYVVVPEQIGIDNVDLTCIFGNVFENAIEGCLRLSDGRLREIAVTARSIDGRLRIQVENPCRDDIAFEADLPKTQKQNGGTGIKSLIYTAERYEGTLGFSISNGKFITQIVLNELHKS
ncbi:hypothetical protein JCM19376_41800 [Fusibacter bizertensis]